MKRRVYVVYLHQRMLPSIEWFELLSEHLMEEIGKIRRNLDTTWLSTVFLHLSQRNRRERERIHFPRLSGLTAEWFEERASSGLSFFLSQQRDKNRRPCNISRHNETRFSCGYSFCWCRDYSVNKGSNLIFNEKPHLLLCPRKRMSGWRGDMSFKEILKEIVIKMTNQWDLLSCFKPVTDAMHLQWTPSSPCSNEDLK